jgi:hypothetical protein
LSSPSFDLEKRFVWGINIDDVWKFTGLPPPPSIIIPHFISVRLPRGPMNFDEETRQEVIAHEGEIPKEEGTWTIEATAEKMRNTGIKMVRIWFPWSFFEPRVDQTKPPPTEVEEANYDWPLDEFVKILSDHEIGIIPVLGCGYARMVPKGVDVDRRTLDYIQRLTICSRAVVRRYKDKIHNWQIENEMNWLSEHYAVGWRKGNIWIDRDRLREFIPDILKRLYDGVKAEDFNAKVMVNLEADAKTIDYETYGKCSDIVGLDVYPNYKSAHPINVDSFDKAKDIRKEIGKPVYICETGYPTGP